MTLKTIGVKALFQLKKHSPTLMSAVAVGGVITTAYLASKATLKARDRLDKEQYFHGVFDGKRDQAVRMVKSTWDLYVPAGAAGLVTIGCIVGSNRIGLRRAAAAQAALFVAERTFDEYKDKVAEKFGDKKEQEVRDEIARDKVHRSEPIAVLSAPGSVLTCELYTGRFFTSDMETLRRAMNDLNQRIIAHDYATMDDWYDMIGLATTTYSSDTGWYVDKLMGLEFTTILTKDGRPCLAFSYNYVKPLYN